MSYFTRPQQVEAALREAGVTLKRTAHLSGWSEEADHWQIIVNDEHAVDIYNTPDGWRVKARWNIETVWRHLGWLGSVWPPKSRSPTL